MTANPLIFGTGAALPETVLTSANLEEKLKLPAGWIAKRTGIRERRIAPEGVGVSQYAAMAARDAISDANLDPADIDLLILATSTPDRLLPPTAPEVAHMIGTNAGAIDLAGACCGFVQALALASHAVMGGARAAVIIGANLLSRRTNWNDPATAALFADGAGALAIRRPEVGAQPLPRPHAGAVLATHLASMGEFADHIQIAAGGSREPFSPDAWEQGRHLMRMDAGDEVFKIAVRGMADAATAACRAASIDLGAVRWLVPHQANARLIARVAHELGIGGDNVISNVERVGNTSAASIPLAFHEAARAGKFSPGDLILLTAAGAGFSAAAALLQW